MWGCGLIHVSAVETLGLAAPRLAESSMELRLEGHLGAVPWAGLGRGALSTLAAGDAGEGA